MADGIELVVAGGSVVTEGEVVNSDIGIRGGRIVAIEPDLEGAHTLDASGRIVVPGGIEAHCHIEQESSLGGVMTADDFLSATRSAAFGGNTTVIPFACQRRGQSVSAVVDDYLARARAKSVLDFTFHLMVTDPTPVALEDELPDLLSSGYRSVKVYMAYEQMRVDDLGILKVLEVARDHDALVMVHAENWDMIRWATERLRLAGDTEARHHPRSHPPLAEVEAINRVIRLNELVGARMLILHVSTPQGLERIGRAEAAGERVNAETCPQYLFVTADDVDRPGPEAAMFCCSPPLRDSETQTVLWRGVEDGSVALVSSDHCPYRMDATGKLFRNPNPAFYEVPNGLPGIEVRLPLLFSGAVSTGRIDLLRFAALSATNAAKLNRIYPRKGVIAVGADADLAIWDPDRHVVLTASVLHDEAGYTPYEGIEVEGWPVSVIGRGEVLVDEGELHAEPGRGLLLDSRQGEQGPAW